MEGVRWRTAIIPVRLPGDTYQRAHDACWTAGLLWNKANTWLHAEWESGNHKVGQYDIRRFLTSLALEKRPLHAHSTEGIAYDLHDALKTYRENRKQGLECRAPWREKHYRPLSFSAGFGWRIRPDRKTLHLSLGRGREGIDLPLPEVIDPVTGKSVPSSDWGQIQLCWDRDARQWSLHIACLTPEATTLDPDKVVAIDEGIINPFALATYVDEKTIDVLVINGREARAIKRERNKAVGQLDHKLSRTKDGSRRHRQLMLAKKKHKARGSARLFDFDHQVAAKAAKFIKEHDAGRVVVGDVRGIEQKTEKKRRLSRHMRQQCSQWGRGRQEDHLEHCIGHGLEYLDESYSSQTCPACGARNRPSGRKYRCRNCHFTCHRDAVGAINILMRSLHGSYLPIDPDTKIRVTYLRAVPRFSPQQRERYSARCKAKNQAHVALESESSALTSFATAA
jgi:transposase